MLALSIREPWAYCILYLGKDVENRTWPTKERGRIYIHVSKSFDYNGYRWLLEKSDIIVPTKESFWLGGIVGSVEIIDCVTKYNSPWFFGPYGFVLRNPVKEKFRPYKGQLGFFEVEL